MSGFQEEKGSGGAYGGQWIPKKEADERFLREPGELKSTDTPTTRGGYRIETIDWGRREGIVGMALNRSWGSG